jgi:hypothetical protein
VEQDVKHSKSGVEPKKKQQILVPHDFSDAGQCAVSYGLMLAQIFHCELTLIHVIPASSKTPSGVVSNVEEAARSRLAQISGRLLQNAGVPVNAYVFKGKLREIIIDIIDRINAIVFVAGLNTVNRLPSHYFSPKDLVSDYRELRIPILIVQNKMPDINTFSSIVLPIDFTRESKEKASWAGYLGKLNHSAVTVVHTEYKDGFFAVQIRNNLMLVKKLFNTLGTRHEIHKAERLRYSLDRYCVSFAKMKGAGMLIITATKDFGFAEFMLGPVEKKIISNEDQLPVMLINPRDDLFVPCL